MEKKAGMECLLQYLDDIEDAFYASVHLAEPIRRAALNLLLLVTSILVPVAGVVLALVHWPLALAAVSLVTVGYMYRSVVSPSSVLSRG
ncbi:MAG: hypothetical protein WD078_15755 [Woeseia sp.]